MTEKKKQAVNLYLFKEDFEEEAQMRPFRVSIGDVATAGLLLFKRLNREEQNNILRQVKEAD